MRGGTRTTRGGRAWRRVVAGVVAATVLAACAPSGGPDDRASLLYTKQTVFGQWATNLANGVAAGVDQPVLEFNVAETPPSIFVNYVVPDAQAAAFESFVDLPPGFSLAKVQILESDPAPRYWLSLNVYRVTGITNGLRAEWSTYVDTGDGAPRFMIIRARASEGSIDPLGPVAPAEPIAHAVDGTGLIATSMNRTTVEGNQVVVSPDNLFSSTIQLPEPIDRQYVEPTRQWVAANDFIYWMNGVDDRIFHNGTSNDAPLISVDPADVTLDDDTEWAPFVDPVPGHVLVYLEGIQFMIGPWWNVTEPDGLVDPATRATLREYKKTLYTGLMQIQAAGVQLGQNQPIVQVDGDDAPPATSWHWRIPAEELAAFVAAAKIPAGLSPAPVSLEEGDAPDHWLTLQVRPVSGEETGLRAEWSTYVDDGSGVRTLVIEARADHSWLDVTNVVNTTFPRTAPYPVSHAEGATLETTVGSGPTAFTSSFVIPPAGSQSTVLAAREWVTAGDLRYAANGIVDRVFYESSVLEPRISIDPLTATVVDGGPWTEFVGDTPDRIWVDRRGTDQVVNPWWNL